MSSNNRWTLPSVFLAFSPAWLFFLAVGVSEVEQIKAWDVRAAPVLAELNPEEDLRAQPSVAQHLSLMDARVRKSVAYVRVVNEPCHFQSWAAAHCHENGVICFKPDAMRRWPYLIWHEAWHARHFTLGMEAESAFSKKLAAIKGGEVSDYARTDDAEKWAEFGYQIHFALSGIRSAFDAPRYFDGDVTAEQRLFALACEYGFLNEAQIETLLQKYPAFKPKPVR